MNICSSNWCISLPPPPCATSTLGYCWMGMGQERLKSALGSIGLEVLPSVSIIRRARALRGHHGGAQRMFGRASRAEGGTVVRFLEALENQSADALSGLLYRVVSYAEFPLCVPSRIPL